MDKDVFVQNVEMLCLRKGIKPTNACKESGVGGSFISDIKRGRDPATGKVQMLAKYLGVTTSDLLGEQNENSPPSDEDRLLAGYDALSARNREKLEEYLDLLLSSQDRP